VSLLRKILMVHEDRRPISRVTCDLSEETREFLTGLARPPIGETTIAQKLEAIIDMQKQIDNRMALQDTRLETMHGLLADLVAALTDDPEKIKEITDAVRSVKEKLKSSVDSQTPKGE